MLGLQGDLPTFVVIYIAAAAFLAGLCGERLRAKLARQAWRKRRWRSSGNPIAAIEYQGHGHYQGTAAARDAVKKEALRRAGVRYIAVTPESGTEDMAREISRIAQAEKLTPVGKSRLREPVGWTRPEREARQPWHESH